MGWREPRGIESRGRMRCAPDAPVFDPPSETRAPRRATPAPAAPRARAGARGRPSQTTGAWRRARGGEARQGAGTAEDSPARHAERARAQRVCVREFWSSGRRRGRPPPASDRSGRETRPRRGRGCGARRPSPTADLPRGGPARRFPGRGAILLLFERRERRSGGCRSAFWPEHGSARARPSGGGGERGKGPSQGLGERVRRPRPRMATAGRRPRAFLGPPGGSSRATGATGRRAEPVRTGIRRRSA